MKKALKYCTSLLLQQLLILLITCNFVNSQTIIEDYIENKEFKNNLTGLIFSYGYLPQYNTSGITIRNKHEAKFYFVNCSRKVSSDEQSMVIEDCMRADDGAPLAKFYVYRTKVIQILDKPLPEYNTDKLVFEIIPNKSSFNNTKVSPNAEEEKISMMVRDASSSSTTKSTELAVKKSVVQVKK